MERREYERLIAALKALEGITDWRTYFGDRMTKFNGEEKKLIDVVGKLLAAESYDKLDKNLKAYDEWVDDVNKSVSNMQQIAKFNGVKINADNTVEKTADVAEARKDETELDKNFFGRIAKTFAKARKDSWKNSTSFDNMEKELGKLNDLLNSNIPEDERDKKLYDALEELDKKADKYLEHKVKRGVNENATAKVEATASMKEYIKERKAEIFRRQLAKDTKDLLVKDFKGENPSVYRLKQVDVDVTDKKFSDLFDKLNISSEKKMEMTRIFELSHYMMHYADMGFNHELFTTIATEEEVASSFLTTEFMRNELLAGGGEITPMMKQFMEEPEAFRRTMESGLSSTKMLDYIGEQKFDVKKVKEYASRDTNANVVITYANSPHFFNNKNLFESELAYTTYKIEEEKAALERQKAENAAREKVKLEELKKQEKAKEVAEKYKENLYLSRSYAALAKFAKEHNFSGPDWDGKIDEYIKLSKEFQEKAMFGEKDVEEVEEKKTGKVNKTEKNKSNKSL